MSDDVEQQLEQRLGRVHARLRLGIEAESGHRVFGGGINFFHPENWYSAHALIKTCLKLSGLYNRGVSNARNIQLRHNEFFVPALPGRSKTSGCCIYRIYMSIWTWKRPGQLLTRSASLDYDLCVLTGDYRAMTFGPYDKTLEAMRLITEQLRAPTYGVLGNHDSIRMVPGLESQGINMLLNESVVIERGDDRIALAGVDDAHYFRVDNLEKAADGIPDDTVSILLSHTPEIYRHAHYAQFECHVERPHPWRADLPAGRDPGHARLTLSAPHRLGAMALPGHARLYLGRRRHVHRQRSPELPARGDAAPPASGQNSLSSTSNRRLPDPELKTAVCAGSAGPFYCPAPPRRWLTIPFAIMSPHARLTRR